MNTARKTIQAAKQTINVCNTDMKYRQRGIIVRFFLLLYNCIANRELKNILNKINITIIGKTALFEP
jgi:hypothetical protein